jgi:hypothetical protein
MIALMYSKDRGHPGMLDVPSSGVRSRCQGSVGRQSAVATRRANAREGSVGGLWRKDGGFNDVRDTA